MLPLNQSIMVITNQNINNLGTTIDALPNEICLHVMSFLPTPTVGLTRRVDRSWNHLISTTYEKTFNTFIFSKDLLLRCKLEAKSLFFNIYQRDVILYEIAKVEALIDLTAAKATAERIQDSYHKAQALLEIVKVAALTDFAFAKDTAEHIQNPSEKAIAFREIVKVEALIDLTAVKKTAERIQDPFYKDQAFIEIIKVEALIDLTAARATAKLIETTHQKILAIMEIIKRDPKYNFTAAKATARSIQSSPPNPADYKPQTFIEIVAVQALQNLETANITIETTIQDPHDKIMARLEIVKALRP